ncbi:Lrp/AsnC family transcriptional regulator [Aquihabitans daechungensis]|uniref:Lrp/AsnC family transcriptional regulator n=1 Tax=Aquihabitans daechungensis TaxID=1052257 RepID=UPI003BA1804A
MTDMGASRRNGRTARAAAAPALDDIDKAIIRALQVDGRMSYAKLGPEVGLSQAAVRQRVQRLTDSGVMQVVAVTDPLSVGFTVQAMIGVRAEGDLRALGASLGAIAEIDYVVIASGSFDLLLEVVCEDNDQLLDLVNDVIRATPGVRSAEVFTYLDLVKQTYSWGTR